ncbi:MAG: Txe/YoeB family addiction module toxin [Gordonia sp. (in: high G+C Gram-positive bacteria)]|uniref:Txe/YoeB family addiction module toxin n=1 Tax=Gordonia sp. (in: high G+C Gram-positive bacteria) TaxID=84139 RepID=UPI0039E54A21
MNVAFTDDGWEDFTYWMVQDRRKVKRIVKLIEAVKRDPYAGEGKPERLKHFPGQVWSRRIDQEHRLVYVVTDSGEVVIQQCRYHY